MFAFMFLLYALACMTKSMFSSAMAVIVEEGFMTKSQTGLINAVFWFVYAFGQILGGFLVDRYSPHKLVMIGICGSIIANLIIYFHQSYSVIMIALSASVMLISSATPFIQSYSVLHFEEYGRIGTVSGLLNSAASIGNILASYVFAKMSEVMSWQNVAISWVSVIVFCVMLCIIVLPRWTRFTG